MASVAKAAYASGAVLTRMAANSGNSLIRTELTAATLKELFANEVRAIHVSKFYDPSV